MIKLEVGTVLIKKNNYGVCGKAVIERLTKTQAITKDGIRFDIEQNNPNFIRCKGEQGMIWNRPYYSIASENDLAELEKKVLIKLITNIDWNKLKIETLKQIKELISKEEKE